MKSKMILAFTMLFMTSTSFAQNSVSMKVQENPFTAKGIRVGYSKPFLSFGYDYKGRTGGGYIDENFNGINIGYAQLPTREMGFIGALSYFQVKTKETGQELQLVRIDGNAAYAFNKMLFAKAGFNVSNFTKFSSGVKVEPNVGAQTGLGIQFTKNIGLDLGFTLMRMTVKPENDDGSRLTYNLSGLEVGLNGTF